MFNSPILTVVLTIVFLALCAGGYFIQQYFLTKRHSNDTKKYVTVREKFLLDLDALRDGLSRESAEMLRTLHWVRDVAEINLLTQGDVSCTIAYANTYPQSIVMTKTVDGYLYRLFVRYGKAKNKEPYTWILVEGPGVFIDAGLDALECLGIFATYGKADLVRKQQELEQRAAKEKEQA